MSFERVRMNFVGVVVPLNFVHYNFCCYLGNFIVEGGPNNFEKGHKEIIFFFSQNLGGD